METVSTARVLADRALGRTCGQACVDWATGMLARGYDGRRLAVLAGMSGPLNHFELADLRDAALAELGVPPAVREHGLQAYACELLRRVRDAAPGWEAALAELRRLCIDHGYCDDLYDFYLLDFAHTDLAQDGVQRYWDLADGEDLDEVIRRKAGAYIEAAAASEWYRALAAL